MTNLRPLRAAIAIAALMAAAGLQGCAVVGATGTVAGAAVGTAGAAIGVAGTVVGTAAKTVTGH
jgi:hypothetical protein